MGLQNQTLTMAEHDWFATLSNLPTNAPLTQHKSVVFANSGFGGSNKPLSQMEREWLQSIANSTSRREGDLWREAVARIGLTPSVYTSENKRNFYTSDNSLLLGGIISTPGLVEYHPFNERSGLTAFNAAPATLNTTNADISGASVNRSGLKGPSYYFNGVNGAVGTSANPSLSPTGNFTYLTMVSLETISFTGLYTDGLGTYLMDRNANVPAIIALKFVAGPLITFQKRYDDNTGLAGTSGTSIAIGSWSMLVGTRDAGSQFSLYVNAALRGIIGDTGGALTPPKLRIGSHLSTVTSVTQGFSQHTAIFNRSLATTEITRLAQLAGLA